MVSHLQFRLVNSLPGFQSRGSLGYQSRGYQPRNQQSTSSLRGLSPAYQPRGQPLRNRPRFNGFRSPSPGNRPGTPDCRFSSPGYRSPSSGYGPRWSDNRPSNVDQPRRNPPPDIGNVQFTSGPGQPPRIVPPRATISYSPRCCWVCGKTDCRSYRHNDHKSSDLSDQPQSRLPRNEDHLQTSSGNSSRGPRAGQGPQVGQTSPTFT